MGLDNNQDVSEIETIPCEWMANSFASVIDSDNNNTRNIGTQTELHSDHDIHNIIDNNVTNFTKVKLNSDVRVNNQNNNNELSSSIEINSYDTDLNDNKNFTNDVMVIKVSSNLSVGNSSLSDSSLQSFESVTIEFIV